MELMQLEMFVAVVEEGSVQKASERVYRTQPAVSIAMRKLEQELGSRLFDRSQRYAYHLTPAGELFFTYATSLLALRNEAVTALADLTQCRRGDLRIGANESTSLYLLPRLRHAFHKKYPDIRIEVLCDNSEKLLRELKERHLDLALLAYLPDDDEMETKRIMGDEVVLIVGPEHRLATKGSVHMRELGAESVIVESTSSSSRERVAEAFSQFATPLNIQVECATIEAIKKMVATGLGIGFVPLMCVQDEVARGELVRVPLEGFPQDRALWVVRRRADEHSHACGAFMQVINSLATKLSLRLPDQATESRN